MTIAASFNDRCSSCGDVMNDNEGCPSAFLCDDCCKAAGHEHPWLIKPQKETTVSSTPLIKDIIVARAGRNFRNGNQEFDLTPDNIDEIISNFDVLKKQVPLILAPEHLFGAKKSAIPASGWVERMYRDGDVWRAVVKFVGDAAEYVANDQFRGVSIGTVLARDVHGKEVGEALDHLLLTNSPFFPLNIAATASGVAAAEDGVVVRYLTSAPTDSTPTLTPMLQAQQDLMRAVAADDSAAAAAATERIVKLQRGGKQ